jgi:hypothetical protein
MIYYKEEFIMSNYLTVWSITPKQHYRTDWKDYWEIEYTTDYEIILKSKEKYKYDFEEDAMKFDYHLVLHLEVLEIEELNNQIYSTLYLVPTPENLEPKKVQQVYKDYDVKPHMIDFDMMSSEFIFPVLSQEIIDIKNIQEFSEKDKYIEKYLLSASIASENINMLLGFYMDKTMNMIGTTNWDLLHSCLEDIDPFKVSLDRISQNINKEDK